MRRVSATTVCISRLLPRIIMFGGVVRAQTRASPIRSTAGCRASISSLFMSFRRNWADSTGLKCRGQIPLSICRSCRVHAREPCDQVRRGNSSRRFQRRSLRGASGRIKFIGGLAWATGNGSSGWRTFSPAFQPRQASWSEIRRDTSTIGGMRHSFRMTGGSPKP